MNNEAKPVRTGRIAAFKVEPLLLPTLHEIKMYRVSLTIVSNYVRFTCQEVVHKDAVSGIFTFVMSEAANVQFSLTGERGVTIHPRTTDLSLLKFVLKHTVSPG